MSRPLLRREDVKRIDQLALESQMDLSSLIEEVGHALSHWFQSHIPTYKKVLICVGPGHNGDDGLALAKKLHVYGYDVKVWLLPNQDESSLRKSLLESLPPHLVIASLEDCHADVCVDALFGVGLCRELDPKTQSLLDKLNQGPFLRIALDIPTGVDANTGELWAQSPFKAEHTLGVGASKVGLHLHPGYEYVGQETILPIGSLTPIINSLGYDVFALGDLKSMWLELQPQKSTHKYKRGVVGIVQHRQFPGAALLAARAAQATGAGYVQIYSPEELLAQQQIHYPGLVFQSYSTTEELESKLQENSKVHCWLLGAGWPQSSKCEVSSFDGGSKGNTPNLDLKKLNSLPPVVWDAGLLDQNLTQFLSKHERHQDLVTPHWGEAQRLLPMVNKANTSRWEFIETFANQAPATLLLKGYDSLIHQATNTTHLTTWNAPSLAFAGSGDLLAGICASLIAQGLSAHRAAQLALDTQRQVAQKFPVACTPGLFLKFLSEFINSTVSP